MLYLASKSPRRRELLTRLGVAFEVVGIDIPELRQSGELPLAYVRRVAREKASAGLQAVGDDPNALVLGSDTEVVLDDEVFGKPADAGDAAAMLRRLSGRTHQVISAMSLLSPTRALQAVSISHVTFDRLDEARIAAYVATGEPFGKAGGYAIQGSAEGLIAWISGSHSGVIGLPLFETRALLKSAGFPVG